MTRQWRSLPEPAPCPGYHFARCRRHCVRGHPHCNAGPGHPSAVVMMGAPLRAVQYVEPYERIPALFSVTVLGERPHGTRIASVLLGTIPATMLISPPIDPVALQIGPLAIHWYGLSYLAAFGLFMLLGCRRLRHPPFAGRTGP